MIKFTQRTLNIIDLLVRHSFHYWIWTFCALFIILDKLLHMPLELLNHFNFIPEFIINLSKLSATKPVDVTIPEINVIPTNNDELIGVLKESISLLHQELSLMSNKFDKVLALLQDNTVLLQNQLNFQKELFNMVEFRLTNINVSTDLININNKLQDMNALIQALATSQVEMDSRILVQIKNTVENLTTLNNNILDINKSILNLDFNKPLVNINDALNQVVINQKDLHTMYQNTQDINLQGFNTIFQSQEAYFAHTQEQLNNIFSKVHEVRNHNLTLHQQLTKTIDIKLVEQQNEIIHQIIDEMNRIKTTKTEVNTVKSWSGFFDKTK